MSLSPAFAAVLRLDRETFNAQFAHARRARPALGEGERFAAFLRDAADPVVAAVPGAAAPAVGAAAFEVALELVGARLDGPAVADGWRRVLPAAAPAVAAAPRRMLAAVSNALCALAGTPDARPDEWTETMTRLAPAVGDDVGTFRRLGQVAAWRAGLAHFRVSALAVADTLPEALAAAVVGTAEGVPWAETRARLAADPWWSPGKPDPVPLQLASKAGGFRGFGGPFPEPPRVVAAAGDFLVLGGDECRRLTADAFGATFHWADPAEFAHAHRSPPPLGLRVHGKRVEWHGQPVKVRVPGELLSAAASADGRTLALTGSLTHAVLLVPLPLPRP